MRLVNVTAVNTAWNVVLTSPRFNALGGESLAVPEKKAVNVKESYTAAEYDEVLAVPSPSDSGGSSSPAEPQAQPKDERKSSTS